MSLNYLCDVVDAIRYIQGRGYDVNSSANLEENIKLFRGAAHDKICGHLSYEILSTVYTDEMYDGTGTHFLDIINRPVTTLTTIKYDNTVQTSSLYAIHGSAIYCEDDFFHEGIGLWKISYTAGYTRTTMPDIIKLAALQLIMLYSMGSGPKGNLGQSSTQQAEGSSITWDPDVEKKILAEIDSYRSM